MRWVAWMALLLWVAPIASAQDQLPLDLEWRAPSGCPAAADVRAELARVAQVRPGYTLTPLAARGEVARQGGGFAVVLHTEHEGRRGQRRLEAADCLTLLRKITLVLALAFGPGVEVTDPAGASALDGSQRVPTNGTRAAGGTASSGRGRDASGHGGATAARAAAAGRERAGDPSDRRELASDRDADDETEDEAADPGAAEYADAAQQDDSGSESARGADGVATPLSLGLIFGAGAQFGLLPSAAFTALAGAELTFGAFAIGVRGLFWPGVNDEPAPDVRAHFDGLAGALQGCATRPLGTASLGLCATFQAAAISGKTSSRPTLRGDSSTAPWFGAGGMLAAGWPRRSRLQLRVEVGLTASLTRPRFEVEGLGSVHRIGTLLTQLDAGIVFAP